MSSSESITLTAREQSKLGVYHCEVTGVALLPLLVSRVILLTVSRLFSSVAALRQNVLAMSIPLVASGRNV